MNPQFFADNRDLFKFDLAQTLVKSNPQQLNGIYYIPMLTPNDGTYRSKARAGTGTKLMEYLDDCLNARRDIREIKEYYHSQNIDFKIYKETEYFTHNQRDTYFEQAIKTIPDNSLILVDPDNGMGVKIPNEKHIKFDELKGLYDKMNNNSLLMIFQFFKRFLKNERKKEYIKERIEDIKEHIKLKGDLCFISDNDITFFLLTKTPAMSKRVEKSIKDYNKNYKDLYITA